MKRPLRQHATGLMVAPLVGVDGMDQNPSQGHPDGGQHGTEMLRQFGTDAALDVLAAPRLKLVVAVPPGPFLERDHEGKAFRRIGLRFEVGDRTGEAAAVGMRAGGDVDTADDHRPSGSRGRSHAATVVGARSGTTRLKRSGHEIGTLRNRHDSGPPDNKRAPA